MDIRCQQFTSLNYQKILLTLDIFSYFSATYQIVIKRDYELGSILTIISLLLNLFLYFAAHEIRN